MEDEFPTRFHCRHLMIITIFFPLLAFLLLCPVQLHPAQPIPWYCVLPLQIATVVGAAPAPPTACLPGLGWAGLTARTQPFFPIPVFPCFGARRPTGCPPRSVPALSHSWEPFCPATRIYDMHTTTTTTTNRPTSQPATFSAYLSLSILSHIDLTLRGPLRRQFPASRLTTSCSAAPPSFFYFLGGFFLVHPPTRVWSRLAIAFAAASDLRASRFSHQNHGFSGLLHRRPADQPERLLPTRCHLKAPPPPPSSY